GGIGHFMDSKPGLLRLVEVVAEHGPDVDLARAHAGHARGRIRNASDHQFLEGSRLAPVVGHRLEAVIVALPAFDVPLRSGAAFSSATGSRYFFDVGFW